MTDDPTPTSDKPETLRLKALVARVATRSGLKPRDLRPTIEATLAELGAALAAGEPLQLPGLGMLRVTRQVEPGVMVVRVRQVQGKEKSEEAGAEPLAAAEEA